MLNAFKTIIKPTLILIIICAVVSGLLSATYNLAGIEALASAGLSDEELAANMETALPGAASLARVNAALEESPVIAVYRDEGGAGSAYYVNTSGYEDGLKLLVGLTPDGAVAGISVVAHMETNGIGTKALDPTYLSQYNGTTGSASVDVVGGATYTSKGVSNAVNAALAVYEQVKGELAQ